MTALELRIPPPVLAGLFAFLMWLVARELPGLHMTLPGATFVAGALAAAGVILCLTGVLQFRLAQTTVNPLKPNAAASLVTSGVYRFTRNPMYLGLGVVLLGWAVYLANPATVIVIAAFIACITRLQIVPEERALDANFGAAFDAYRSRVRRWL